MSGSKFIVDSALRTAVHLRSSTLPSELIKSSQVLFSAIGAKKQTLPDLPYDYDALARKFLSIISSKCFLWRCQRNMSILFLFAFHFRDFAQIIETES
jgi:hypothetical protein